MDVTNEGLFAVSRKEVCGHCFGTSVWHIVTQTPTGYWADYECDYHAKEWWPHLFPVTPEGV